MAGAPLPKTMRFMVEMVSKIWMNGLLVRAPSRAND
jgi:hypothetical protein